MEPAWAKLNLSLDVLGARPDGFHDLRMVMQSVDLHDDVTVTLDDTGTCRAETNRSYLPCGADNVAVRAAQVFLARAGLTCGVHIRLHKRIPVCAGLGGGSSDAAAVLRALERLTGAGFTRTQLEEMGAEIGSDVPYCVAGGTVLAEGRGERLTPVTPMPRLPVVICKPDFPISTPGASAPRSPTGTCPGSPAGCTTFLRTCLPTARARSRPSRAACSTAARSARS